MVVTAKVTRGMIVTICNYDYYQNPENYEGQNEKSTKGATKSQRGASEGRTKEKKVKKENNVRRKKTKTTSGFDLFWSEWPKHARKTGKANCMSKWAKDGLEGRSEHIVAVVRAMRKHELWLRENGRYIPAPLVWLNQERYDCEVGDITSGEDRRHRDDNGNSLF
jgi:hypothetical protein